MRGLHDAQIVRTAALRVDRDCHWHVAHLEGIDGFHAEVFERPVSASSKASRTAAVPNMSLKTLDSSTEIGIEMYALYKL